MFDKELVEYILEQIYQAAQTITEGALKKQMRNNILQEAVRVA